jgi:formiminoglutamase
MSSGSSNVVEWFTRLEPAREPDALLYRSDDPRVGEIVEYWRGDPASLKPGLPVLVGFPQDDGVRRNQGRPGAARAPVQIRHWLYRLTAADCAADIDLRQAGMVDAGLVRILSSLEDTQNALAEVIAGILRSGAVPVVLGGGHETAYGHYLGYAATGSPVAIINIDAHLDLRPFHLGHGDSGSPFRQALEHPTHPLPGNRYVCLGAQPHSVSRQHYQYAREHGCVVRWADEVKTRLLHCFQEECDRLRGEGCRIYVTVDADAVRAADVPGVSAPNVVGLEGAEVSACARWAGTLPQVSSLDVVEINPRYDPDGLSARWGALLVWNFLVGLASRERHG